MQQHRIVKRFLWLDVSARCRCIFFFVLFLAERSATLFWFVRCGASFCRSLLQLNVFPGSYFLLWSDIVACFWAGTSTERLGLLYEIILPITPFSNCLLYIKGAIRGFYFEGKPLLQEEEKRRKKARRDFITPVVTCASSSTMPRAHQKVESDGSLFSRIVEQGWLAFLLLGIFMIGLRLYNVKQRRDQRKLLREGLMAEMGYRGKANKKD